MKKDLKMKYTTAVNQIKKECEFLGLTLMQVVQDVQKYGRMIYSQRTVEAVNVYVNH
jgi:hypothetical protein